MAAVVSVLADTTIELFASSVASGARIELGSISYDSSTNTTVSQIHSDLGRGDYCIGTESLHGHECFTYLEVSEAGLNGQFVLFVDNLNDVSDISLVAGNSGLQAVVQKIAAGPQPNLNPSMAVPKKEPLKVIVKKIVENEKGEKIEVEEVEEVAEDTRSWVQKNWMYIVPPLLIVMMLIPEEKEKK